MRYLALTPEQYTKHTNLVPPCSASEGFLVVVEPTPQGSYLLTVKACLRNLEAAQKLSNKLNAGFEVTV